MPELGDSESEEENKDETGQIGTSVKNIKLDVFDPPEKGDQQEEEEESDEGDASEEGWTTVPLKETSKAMRAQMKAAREGDAKRKRR